MLKNFLILKYGKVSLQIYRKRNNVGTNVIKKINWSLPGQRVGVEEAIALPERLNNKYNIGCRK